MKGPKNVELKPAQSKNTTLSEREDEVEQGTAAGYKQNTRDAFRRQRSGWCRILPCTRRNTCRHGDNPKHCDWEVVKDKYGPTDLPDSKFRTWSARGQNPTPLSLLNSSTSNAAMTTSSLVKIHPHMRGKELQISRPIGKRATAAQRASPRVRYLVHLPWHLKSQEQHLHILPATSKLQILHQGAYRLLAFNGKRLHVPHPSVNTELVFLRTSDDALKIKGEGTQYSLDVSR